MTAPAEELSLSLAAVNYCTAFFVDFFCVLLILDK